jgi:hypothetical protein
VARPAARPLPLAAALSGTVVREDAAVGDIETWTADECAAAWGVKTPTWLG